MLKIKNGSGNHMTEKKNINMKAIISFFESNPGSTKTECARITGLSVMTIFKHIKEIEMENKQK